MVSGVGAPSPYYNPLNSANATLSGSELLTDSPIYTVGQKQASGPVLPPPVETAPPTDSSDSSDTSDTTTDTSSTYTDQSGANQYFYSSQIKYSPYRAQTGGHAYYPKAYQPKPYPSQKKSITYDNPPAFQPNFTPRFNKKEFKPEIVRPELPVAHRQEVPQVPPIVREQPRREIPQLPPVVRQESRPEIPQRPPIIAEQTRQEFQKPQVKFNPFLVKSGPVMPQAPVMPQPQPVNPMLLSMMASARKPQPSGQSKNWTEGLFSGIMDNYFGGQTPSSNGITETAGLQFTSGY